MPVPVESILLRVFIGEDDRHNGAPLYQALVAKALEFGMAGATVLPGPEGFGNSRGMRSESDAGPRTPMVVEIVDSEARINEFLPLVDEMVTSGLVTLERVWAIHYSGQRRADQRRQATPPAA